MKQDIKMNTENKITTLNKKQGLSKQLADIGHNYILNDNAIQIVKLDGAVLLAILTALYNMYQLSGQLTPQGEFYCTVDKLIEKTNWKADKQRVVLNDLQNRNLLEVNYHGSPAKRYIKLNTDEITRMYTEGNGENS